MLRSPRQISVRVIQLSEDLPLPNKRIVIAFQFLSFFSVVLHRYPPEFHRVVRKYPSAPLPSPQWLGAADGSNRLTYGE
jgi:hypothetical protein